MGQLLPDSSRGNKSWLGGQHENLLSGTRSREYERVADHFFEAARDAMELE